MRLSPFIFAIFFVNSLFLDALIFHNFNINEEWIEKETPAFNELFVSWNAQRPLKGNYYIYVSAKLKDWSPWMLYASWGSQGQSSYLEQSPQMPVRVYQDALEVLENQSASGFRIKITTDEEASLHDIYSMHIYINADKKIEASALPKNLKNISIEVPRLSQITLDHPRAMDLCSPTSTTAIVRYLSKQNEINPVQFATNVWDSGFDIFGNWVFNTAQASSVLGKNWTVWVERLSGFEDIYYRLQKNTPVVVSVRGPLKGSASAYSAGHLIAVIGYDSKREKVLCMDPAFRSDSQTLVDYDFADFMQAWDRRGRVAYVFASRESLAPSSD